MLFLSNFYPAMVYYEKLWYPRSEYAYQAAKVYQFSLKIPFLAQCELDRLNAKIKSKKDKLEEMHPTGL